MTEFFTLDRAQEPEHEGAALCHRQRQKVAIALARVGEPLLEALLQAREHIVAQRGMFLGMQL